MAPPLADRLAYYQSLVAHLLQHSNPNNAFAQLLNEHRYYEAIVQEQATSIQEKDETITRMRCQLELNLFTRNRSLAKKDAEIAHLTARIEELENPEPASR